MFKKLHNMKHETKGWLGIFNSSKSFKELMMNLMETLGSMKRGAYRNYLVIVGVEVSAAVKPKSNLQISESENMILFLTWGLIILWTQKIIMVLYELCGEQQEQKRHSE